jgi:hypothetical protein
VSEWFINVFLFIGVGKRVTGEPGVMLLMSDNTSTDVSPIIHYFITQNNRVILICNMVLCNIGEIWRMSAFLHGRGLLYRAIPQQGQGRWICDLNS